jgi:ribonuclease P protein component
MITRSHRFHGYGSLKYVYRNGDTARGTLFSIKSVANPRRNSYRLAVVVSRKVNKSAVIRNRIRRRIYETFKEFEPQIQGSPDIVLTIFNDTVAEEPIKNLSKQLKKQLQETGIIK